MLTYSPKTGHVKNDKAVIGRIESKQQEWLYIPYKFDAVPTVAASLEELLKKIKFINRSE